jgi:hypothetical protein
MAAPAGAKVALGANLSRSSQTWFAIFLRSVPSSFFERCKENPHQNLNPCNALLRVVCSYIKS